MRFDNIPDSIHGCFKQHRKSRVALDIIIDLDG